MIGTGVLTGAEGLRREGFARLRGRRVGLLTNPNGVTDDLTALADLLAAAPGVELAALFGPEHGLAGAAAAGDGVASVTHPRLGVPVHSLYGERRAPLPEQLAGLDLLLIDMQDIGARFFTYAWTVALALEACAGIGLPVLLLDRPNPLGGEVLEGPVLEPDQRSFVGLSAVPIRHGLTLGELARWVNAVDGYGADLEVLPVAGWRRAMRWEATGLPWVPPSPNVPTYATATVYPGTCLVEGATITEGRGTTLPFEQVGAPWLDGEALAAALNARDLPGVRWRPVAFTPWHGRKHVGEVCGGVQVHVTDPVACRPVAATVHFLTAARRLASGDFGWVTSTEGGRIFIDILAGTTRLREAIDAEVPPDEIVASWEDELAAFAEARRPYLLYD